MIRQSPRSFLNDPDHGVDSVHRPPSPEAFHRLQERMQSVYQAVFSDPLQERTVVVVPSLTMDVETIRTIQGAHHYEERMLCLLMLLRYPRAKLVFLSSTQIDPSIVDYYLHLLQGIPSTHARRRLRMMHCHDASARPLTEKLLERPRLLDRIRREIENPATAHLTCFTVTDLERRLALELDIPVFGCDPELEHLGSKSGSREVFREAGVPIPPGSENLRDMADAAEALAKLKHEHPETLRAAVKINEGFSGAGNAIFRFDGAPEGEGLLPWVHSELQGRLDYEADDMTWELFSQKFGQMEGIVEAFIEGEDKRSPSVQLRVEPDGTLVEASTHDQVLGGHTGQVFMGCRFPADESYRADIQRYGRLAGEVMRKRGVLGRFAVDFVSVPTENGWDHYAIEVNLRKGGTTHPFLMLQFLTDGRYDESDGVFRTLAGEPRAYFASDNLKNECYKGLTPTDLIDSAVRRRLHFHGATQQGVVFHLIGALSEFGKLGVVAVGETDAKAKELYDMTVQALEAECSE